ncbi:MAG: transketolase [bacterium]|nr:transketolase [bacterium]
MRISRNEVLHLESICRQVRRDILGMLLTAGSGHAGGSLSAVELLVALYWKVLRHDASNPSWTDRDRFILSKGHACPVLYSVLARRGFFPVSDLSTLRKQGSILQGHPDFRKTPGIDVSTGSLGQGLSIANGLSLGGRFQQKNYRVYCLLGDGEIQEGQVWEAAMTAAHYHLNTVCAIVDNNGLQIDGRIEEVKNIYPITEKWRAFNWHVVEVDGHDLRQILAAYTKAIRTRKRPTLILAHTIKGKGISFIEEQVDWHGKAPNQDEYERAMEELAEQEA